MHSRLGIRPGTIVGMIGLAFFAFVVAPNLDSFPYRAPGVVEQPLKAEQPISAKIAYEVEDFTVWCESPSGDKIYVSKVGPGAGGVHMVVVPGGCK